MIEIERVLRKIVSNLWFEWNSDVHLLFRGINPYVWSLFRRNLYRFQKIQAENLSLYRQRLAELLIDPRFLELIQKVERDFKAYMQPTETFVGKNYPELAGKTVAYFSMEYGIDILRIYSGGLGILSGDHLREASDLGLKMVGVGLLYMHGYYEQQVNSGGEMAVVYESLVLPHKPIKDFLPLDAVKRAGTNEDLVVKVPMPGRTVSAKVWKARMGRNDLLLLDTNIPANQVHDRHITRRLYASQRQYEEERRRRLEQELLLGLGGVNALLEGGYMPSAYHINEGHAAFAAVGLLRVWMTSHGLGFEESRRGVADSLGFTTHTPVPEGNERFEERLVREYLEPYLGEFLAPHEREIIFNCARNRENMFDMTKLSLLLSGVYRNGVSKLHGEVCRRMWGYAWGNFDSEGRGVPIDSVTNGVHVPYWQKPALRTLIQQMGGLGKVQHIPDEKIWELHVEFKVKMIQKIRERIAAQLLREKKDVQACYEKAHSVLRPDSFMIGFARRFADYKRVTLLLDDEKRLFQFLESAYRQYGVPVEIIYAGKPHPNNYSGREKVRQIIQVAERLAQRCLEKNFKAEIIFVQGYDIDLARYLEAGVEVWLNNPIRPLEASGTSGMKAGMNGVLNVSVPDGWVPEGIAHGKNGWMFGKGDEHSASRDREELFSLLENEILPLYFQRSRPNDAFSRAWVALMKESIRTITAQFCTERMLAEYMDKMYLPAVRNAVKRAAQLKV